MGRQEVDDLATMRDEKGEVAEEEYMDHAEAQKYRSVAAKVNYLAQDRSDLQYAAKCLCSHMVRPLKACCAMLKRTARYLKGRPRCGQLFPFQAQTWGIGDIRRQ